MLKIDNIIVSNYLPWYLINYALLLRNDAFLFQCSPKKYVFHSCAEYKKHNYADCPNGKLWLTAFAWDANIVSE